MDVQSSWLFWALLSAAFAALTAIFVKVGIENVNSDFATFIRTIVILLAAGGIVFATGKWQAPLRVSAKTLTSLVLSCNEPLVPGRGSAARFARCLGVHHAPRRSRFRPAGA